MIGKGPVNMRETRDLEFKETITNTFLKTVNAFSNYDGGTIVFGIDDNGNVKGLQNVKQACLDIENKSNDSIAPQPNYTIEIQNNDHTVKLTVKSGMQKPYLYKSKAYKRNDTATIEVDTLEFSRLVLDGKNISIIQKRATFENISVLEVYENAITVFRDYYQYEVIQGSDRKKMEKIPESAFREAIANALIHRAWDVESQIRISMFDDKIEIISPGGLPSGITTEEYLAGKLSVLRNRNLANVFYRLGFVEIFGTGITRIKQLYEDALMKPKFEVSENAIEIILPIFEKKINLTEDEKLIYKLLSSTILKPISEIAPYVPFGKSKTTKILQEMGHKGLIKIEGKGRGTKYITM